MTRATGWVVAGCVALAALGATAVLDVGSATAHADASVSPFAGSWFGNWSGGFGDDVRVGTLDWTVSDEGRITGIVTSALGNRRGTLVGHVRDDGKLELVRYAPNDEPSSHYNGFPFHGTVVIDDGNLVVSATGTPSGAPSWVAVLERY